MKWFSAFLLALVVSALSANAATAPIVRFHYATAYDTGGIINLNFNLQRQPREYMQVLPGKDFWLVYKKIDLGTDSYTRFELTARGCLVVAIRADSLNGPNLGRVTIGDMTARRAVDTNVTVGVDIPALTGVRDIYLVVTDFVSMGWALSFSFVGQTTITSPRTFYVAPNGSDADSGTLARPFRTISRAAQVAVGGDICYIRKGIYYETVRPRNSGTAGQPIRFEAYNGESVVISAADTLTGWRQYQGSIYRAPMSWTLGPGANQLFADSAIVYEARFPNINTPPNTYRNPPCFSPDTIKGYAAGCAWSFPSPDLPRGLSTPVCYYFTKGGILCRDMGLTAQGWCENAWVRFSFPPIPSVLANKPVDFFKGAVLWKEGYFFTESGLVTGSRDSAGIAHLDLSIGWWIGSEHRGFITGKLGLLDTENEWVYDSGFAYVWLPNGADPSTVHVAAKRRFVTIDLSQRSDIVMKGIRSIGGTFLMKDSRRCVIDDCHFKYISHYTYWYFGDRLTRPDPNRPLTLIDTLYRVVGCDGAVMSGNDNLVTHSTISYAAGAPVIISGVNNVIKESMIHDFGYARNASIDMLGAHGRLERNSIFNAGRACVAIGSGIREGGNKILYCDLYNSGLFAADGGTYYTYGMSGFNSEIAYNWWRKNRTTGPTSYMYFDGGGASGVRIHHNVFFPHIGDYARTTIPFALPTSDCKLYNNTIAMRSTDDMQSHYRKWNACTTHICAANNLDISDGGLSKWKFVDTTGDFRLTAGSPAIDAGKVIPGITDGHTGAAPDLGAYEFGKDWRPGHTWGGKAWPSLTQLRAEVATNVAFWSTPIKEPTITMTGRNLRLVLPTETDIRVRIFDVMGKCVYDRSVRDRAILIPMSAYQSRGFYLLKVEANGLSYVRKLPKL